MDGKGLLSLLVSYGTSIILLLRSMMLSCSTVGTVVPLAFVVLLLLR